MSAQFHLDGNTCVHAVTKFMFKKVHGGHMRALMQLKTPEASAAMLFWTEAQHVGHYHEAAERAL